MKLSSTALLASSLLLCSTSSQAVNLQGVVTEEGDVLSDVEVMLIDSSNVVVKRDYTDSSGSYRFSVKPGTYKVGATKEEYLAHWVKDISISDKDMDIAIEMTPTAFAEEEELDSSSECD